MRNRGARNVSRGAIAALVAACALALSACGGDDAPIQDVSSGTTSSTTTGGAITQEDFIASGDARCAEANAAIANLGDETTAISSELSITQGLLDGLQEIGDGDDPDGSLADYYAALNDQLRILKQQETAVGEGDTTTISSLESDLDAAKADATSAATAYGFEDCGGEGTTLPEDGTDSTTTTPGATTTTPVTPVAPAPVTPAPVTPTPVDPGGTGGGAPPVTPTPTPTPTPDPGGGSGGVGPG